MSKKIAVIGSGISGLVSAYILSKKYDVSIFEANAYLGGHTNTVSVEREGQKYNIDTGFIVFNKKTPVKRGLCCILYKKISGDL